MDNEVEWIKSGKANLLLIEAGKYPAEFQLRQALLIGQVHARAIRAEISKRGRYGGKDTLDNWEVPEEVWKGSGENSRFDLDADTYSTGDYGVRVGAVKLWGMSFNKAEILAYFDIEEKSAAPSAPTDTTETGKGGRRPDADKWNTTLSALIVYAQCVGIHRDDQPGTVLSKALDYAAGLGMSDDAISIDRCSKGILRGKGLIGKSEGWDAES